MGACSVPWQWVRDDSVQCTIALDVSLGSSDASDTIEVVLAPIDGTSISPTPLARCTLRCEMMAYNRPSDHAGWSGAQEALVTLHQEAEKWKLEDDEHSKDSLVVTLPFA